MLPCRSECGSLRRRFLLPYMPVQSAASHRRSRVQNECAHLAHPRGSPTGTTRVLRLAMVRGPLSCSWLTTLHLAWQPAAVPSPGPSLSPFLDRFEAELVIRALSLCAREVRKPLSRRLRMRCIYQCSGCIGRGLVLRFRNRHSRNRIAHVFLELHLRSPDHPRVRLTFHNPHRRLPMLNLRQHARPILHFVLIHRLIQILSAALSQCLLNLVRHTFPLRIRHGDYHTLSPNFLQLLYLSY